MPSDGPDFTAGLASLLPPCLTPEQRERYAGIAAIVKATTDGVSHARDEFVEPAPVFALQIGARSPRS